MLLPFDTEVEELVPEFQNEFISLKTNLRMKHLFDKFGYHGMWIRGGRDYPQLWSKICVLFVAFPTNWGVESGFSAVSRLVTPQRNRLEISDCADLRLRLTSFSPDIAKIVEAEDMD